MTILLLRHGETEWNLERRYQGRFDSPLTGRGTAQALAIGRLLAMVPEAASAPIVASPQGRARRTAEIILDGDGRYDWYFRSPDGESYETFAGRVADWLGESEQPSLIVVVTHGLVTRVLRGLYIGLPRAVALTLPVPQDRIFRLSAGEIEELAVLGDQVGDRG